MEGLPVRVACNVQPLLGTIFDGALVLCDTNGLWRRGVCLRDHDRTGPFQVVFDVQASASTAVRLDTVTSLQSAGALAKPAATVIWRLLQQPSAPPPEDINRRTCRGLHWPSANGGNRGGWLHASSPAPPLASRPMGIGKICTIHTSTRRACFVTPCCECRPWRRCMSGPSVTRCEATRWAGWLACAAIPLATACTLL